MLECLLERCLCENSKNLMINNRFHKTSVYIEVMYTLNFDSIVFVLILNALHGTIPL